MGRSPNCRNLTAVGTGAIAQGIPNISKTQAHMQVRIYTYLILQEIYMCVYIS
jgi:2-methylaconitate cis-trans-isomerase PrpF